VIKGSDKVKVNLHRARQTLQLFMFISLCLTSVGNLQAQTTGQHHNWSWTNFDNGGATSTISTKYGSKIKLLVAFDARKDCSPVIFYSQSADSLKERLPEGSLNLGFRVRIDNRPLWQVNKGEAVGFYVKDSSQRTTSYHIALPVNTKFVVDLLQGSTLRILRMDNNFTDRFSLKGSAVALRNAYAMCSAVNQHITDPDLRYFDANPPPTQRPKSQDPDRAYFN
jgi:hypothetical protein